MSPGITLGDVRRCACALELLLHACNGIAMGRVQSGRRFGSGSAASYDAVGPNTQIVHALLDHADMRAAAALDQIDTLLAFAAVGLSPPEPAPTYAPFTVARSVVEALAEAAWLIEPTERRTRYARGLSLARRETKSAQAINGDLKAAERVIQQDAARLSFHLVRKDFAAGYAEPIAGRGNMIGTLIPEGGRTYSLLSAISHGETWALVAVGYVEHTRDASGDRIVMNKVPTAGGFHFAIHAAYEGLGRFACKNAAYRDEDMSAIIAILSAANGIEPFASRFWDS